MASKKRASMSEGPLADLFRSTDESVGEDEVRVTATRETTTTSQVEVAVAEPEPEPEAEPRSRHEVDRARSSRSRSPRSLEPSAVVEAPPVEERRVVTAKEGPLSDATLAPHTDPMVEEVDERKPPRSLRRRRGARADARGPRAPDGRRPGHRRAPPSAATSRTPPARRPCRAATTPCFASSESAAPASTPSTAWSRPRCPGVEFIAINTDLQSLQNSNADATLHIGSELTRGLGSGSDPRVGYRAAYDEQDKIKSLLAGLGHGLHRRRSRRRHGHRRGPRRRQAGPRRRRADGRRRHQALRCSRAPAAPPRPRRASPPSAPRSTR